MAPDILKSELMNGEELLWYGHPESKVILSTEDIFFIPLSFLWGGTAIFVEIITFVYKTDFVLKFFGALFAVVGLYLIVGRFIYRIIQKKHTFYAVTNKRIIVLIDLFSVYFNDELIGRISTINKRIRASGTGTIVFGDYSLWSEIFNRRIGLFRFNKSDIPIFYDIQDAETVYSIVLRLKA